MYFAPHHFVLLPLCLIAIGASVYNSIHSPFQQVLYIWLAVAFFLIFFTAVMLRQHYALGNQNRIIRLEMRLRYFVLTGKRFEVAEQQLSFGQIAALRFASDEELVPLVERTLSENLSPKNIKQAVTNWQPDYMRV